MNAAALSLSTQILSQASSDDWQINSAPTATLLRIRVA